MTRICIICEGQTEETFVREVLGPALEPLSIFLTGQTIETSVGNKGGGLSYSRIKKDILNTLKQSSSPNVTTMIDLYRLPTDFPGFEAAQKANNLEDKLKILLDDFQRDITSTLSFDPARFVPYIQPYEFEALLFSDVEKISAAEASWNDKTKKLRAIRSAVISPEHINNSPQTKPAAHLERELSHPKYSKTRHGPSIATEIGLAKIEHECQFFAGWIKKLRAWGATDT